MTGDVVVRTCVSAHVCGCGFSQSLNKCLVSMTPTAEMPVMSVMFLFHMFFSEKPHMLLSPFISLRLGRGFVFCCSSNQFTSDICTATVPLASKSRKLPQSCKSLVPV